MKARRALPVMITGIITLVTSSIILPTNAFATDTLPITEHFASVTHNKIEASVPSMDYQPILWWPGDMKVGDRPTIYFDRFQTANMAGVGAGFAGALLAKVGPATAWVSLLTPFAVGIARRAAYQGGKCATLQFDLYWGWLPNINSWVRNC